MDETRYAIIGIGAVLAVVLLGINTGEAEAQTIIPNTICPGNNCSVAIDDNDGSLPFELGDENYLYVCTADQQRVLNVIFLTSPTQTIYTGPAVTLQPNECVQLSTSDFGLTSGFNEVGDWILVALSMQGGMITGAFAVTFFVVPEAIIGAVALVGAPLAVLTAYSLRKRHTT